MFGGFVRHVDCGDGGCAGGGLEDGDHQFAGVAVGVGERFDG